MTIAWEKGLENEECDFMFSLCIIIVQSLIGQTLNQLVASLVAICSRFHSNVIVESRFQIINILTCHLRSTTGSLWKQTACDHSVNTTSRERPKSAPYLRLKNSKRTSKYSFYGTGKTQRLNRIGTPEATLWNFSSILSQIIKKNWRRGTFGEKFFLKVSQCRKNWKGGPFGIFQHPFCRKTQKNWRGDPLGKKFVPLVPLSFLDDVKILLRKLLKYFI